jgi:hypothetical protein
MTPEKVQQDYEAAMAALRQIALAPGTSAAARLAARDGMRELTARYLGQIELEVQALTAQYQGFITSMTAIVAEVQGGTTATAALKGLTKIVTDGTALFGAVSAIAAGGAPAGARALRGGPRGARRGARTEAAAARDFGATLQVLRVLCVHGVGHQEKDPAFESVWREAISSGLADWTRERAVEIEFVDYDELFAADPPSALDVAKAIAKLTASGIWYGISDLFHRRRGFGDLSESVRWTAGMVVQWAENDALRAASRRRVNDHVERFDPHVVLAHSLGTLLSYDAFARKRGRKLMEGRSFVTFGSQIGNPFVRSTLGGRIEPLLLARHWFHLYNPHDNAFTASLSVPAPNFEQVEAEFDIEGFLDHDAGEYLRHPNTRNIVWRAIALANGAGGARAMTRGASESAVTISKQAVKSRPAKITKPRRRALLVGINEYPDPADRLEGCVNDVFLMSSLLQESGFEADDIRVVLNERATARGILDRLEWLLEGASDQAERVFYYSGHGAQIPGYGVGEKVDRKDECLVSYDFDWSREHAVTDDQFHDLYSQLPYETEFLTIFDCCHSGGMTREGAAKVRGLTPPDDIRHRELEWNARQEMWVPRDFGKVKENVEERKKRPRLFGADGDLNRLGRSADLRTDRRSFQRACRDFGHRGPFMPIIFQACREKQYSYEYRHGVQSYGAFTYSLGVIMREAKRRKRNMTWTQLIKQVSVKLEKLEYDQTPVLVCPSALKNKTIPWGTI